MSRSTTLRLAASPRPGPALLATVELDRRCGAIQHQVFGSVELIDHLVAWVFEDGIVLAAVQGRSVLAGARLLTRRAVVPPRQASLTEVERLDVQHAAGVRPAPASVESPVRWEVA